MYATFLSHALREKMPLDPLPPVTHDPDVTKRSTALCLSLAIFSLCAFAQETPETFLKSVAEALNEQNAAKLDALLYTVGMSEADKQMVKSSQQHLLNNPGVDTIELQPLPEDFQSVFIVHGKRIEPTALPAGIVSIKYKQAGNGMTSISFPYATVEGRFYLIGARSTDLNWKGPEDKNIGFMILGKEADKLKGKVKWNASGVDLEKPITTSSVSFLGQYIEGVTITSDHDDTDVTITILENGNPIFKSDPLKGKGTLEYKRPN